MITDFFPWIEFQLFKGQTFFILCQVKGQWLLTTTHVRKPYVVE